ncbi:MAG TPA: hypothetical protein VGE09_06480 [Pseudoxanthomonas sp.]
MIDYLNHRSGPTFWARLYLAGPIEVAKQILRADVMREGLCVTIEPTHYIYTGGEQSGYVVGLINYPRFPATQEVVTTRARGLLMLLLDETHQKSGLLMTPESTEWYTREVV